MYFSKRYKKTLIVDLKGGLGNQIFILSFANYLRQNGYKVLVDISIYNQKHDFPRDIEVNLKDFEFEIVNIKNDFLFNFLNRRVEEIENIDLNFIKNFSRFKGYYQNLIFLDKDYLKQVLKIKENNKNESLMIHVRKNDYVVLQEDLKLNYFLKAIEIISNRTKIFSIDLFTDDLSLNKIKLENSNIKVKNIFSNDDISPLDTLKKMVNYKHFIISNSTFSLIAAYLGETENSTIVYPTPWFKNSDFKVENMPKNWIPSINC